MTVEEMRRQVIEVLDAEIDRTESRLIELQMQREEARKDWEKARGGKRT